MMNFLIMNHLKKPFPCPREDFEFVGEIFSAVEEFVPENRDVIKRYINTIKR